MPPGKKCLAILDQSGMNHEKREKVVARRLRQTEPSGQDGIQKVDSDMRTIGDLGESTLANRIVAGLYGLRRQKRISPQGGEYQPDQETQHSSRSADTSLARHATHPSLDEVGSREADYVNGEPVPRFGPRRRAARQ